MGYEQSLMFGKYREQLATFARVQAQKTKELEEQRSRQPDSISQGGRKEFLRKSLSKLNKIGGDYLILVVVGCIIAFLSFVMDILIHLLFDGISLASN